MKAKLLAYALPVLIVATIHVAEAQQPAKIPRIGFLVNGTPSTHSTRIQAFRQGLRELGYVEEKNIAIEYRYAAGMADRLSDLVTELVSLKVDVIVTEGTPAVLAPRRRPRRSPLFSLRLAIRSEAGLSTVSRDQEQTSRDCRALRET